MKILYCTERVKMINCSPEDYPVEHESGTTRLIRSIDKIIAAIDVLQEGFVAPRQTSDSPCKEATVYSCT